MDARIVSTHGPFWREEVVGAASTAMTVCLCVNLVSYHDLFSSEFCLSLVIFRSKLEVEISRLIANCRESQQYDGRSVRALQQIDLCVY